MLYKGSMGPSNLTAVERLSTLQRWKCFGTMDRSISDTSESVLYREVMLWCP